MAHLVVITGISGTERWLGHGREVNKLEEARRFRSAGAADAAGRAHCEAFPPVITRHMKWRVEPAQQVARAA